MQPVCTDGLLHTSNEGLSAVDYVAKVEEFRHQLFTAAGADMARVTEFSCGKNDSYIPVVFARGRDGVMNVYASRSESIILILGLRPQLLLNVDI